MLFSLTLTAPFLNEIALTPTTVYLEAGRLSAFLNLWDMPVSGQRWASIEKHPAGKGIEVRLGPVLLSAGIGRYAVDALLSS